MISVAVGIIFKTDLPSVEPKVLLCQRKKNSRYGLKWEFPGGKLDDGELPENALRRELLEELGITVEHFRLFYKESSSYADGGVYDVAFYLIDQFSGEPKNLVFEQWQWVPLNQLTDFDILAGNKNVLQQLIGRFARH